MHVETLIFEAVLPPIFILLVLRHLILGRLEAGALVLLGAWLGAWLVEQGGSRANLASTAAGHQAWLALGAYLTGGLRPSVLRRHVLLLVAALIHHCMNVVLGLGRLTAALVRRAITQERLQGDCGRRRRWLLQRTLAGAACRRRHSSRRIDLHRS